MRQIAFALRLMLVLAVTLVSVHTAIGRAEARGALAVELCIEDGVVTVSLDANGTPVAHDHDCPDCVLSGLASLNSLTLPHPPAGTAMVLHATVLHAALHSAALPDPSARGPPALVPA